MIVAACFGLAGVVASLFIIVEAFKDEIWKGFLCLICGFYLLYFALFDWDHENKWLILLLAVAGGGIAAGITRL